ncbi:hypothetical protein JCM3770_002614 [Rhodotorula araucariae]
MHNAAAGFSASLALLPGYGAPAHALAPPVAEREYATSAPSALERITYIEGGAQGAPLRVCFAREECLQPVRALEAYACYLFCPGGVPWVKIYAVGAGVAPGAGQWCIDGSFGPGTPDLDATLHASISLKIYPCTLLPGTALGNGLLYGKDVEEVHRHRPICVFTWQYASRRHLEQLGVAGTDVESAPLPSPLEPSLALLRHVTRVAFGVLTPAQRAVVADELAAAPEVHALLPPEARAELEAYRASVLAPASTSEVRVRGVGANEGRITRSRSTPGGEAARKRYAESGSGSGSE